MNDLHQRYHPNFVQNLTPSVQQLLGTLRLELLVSHDGQFQKRDGTTVQPTAVSPGLFLLVAHDCWLDRKSVDEVTDAVMETKANAVEIGEWAYTPFVQYFLPLQLYKIDAPR